jgi:hypothetical protein
MVPDSERQASPRKARACRHGLPDRPQTEDATMTENRPPAEGRTDIDVPGANRAGPPSENPEGPIGVEQPMRDIAEDPETERRDELADRVGVGMPSPAGRDQSDLLPDIDVPDEQA